MEARADQNCDWKKRPVRQCHFSLLSLELWTILEKTEAPWALIMCRISSGGGNKQQKKNREGGSAGDVQSSRSCFLSDKGGGATGPGPPQR
ncbi:hypothetical protein SKAU_G00273700 [Synaphobranchus kaupii]|uniref:Uncharacterized protein n=1 Tax=Synaphobranchus kaupii TaxID=118154 RepID=A0A9Q1IQU9_SYNKA|nr:hypothetical protein SKAU_G00273700 [Synaphobranchus kaupii]